MGIRINLLLLPVACLVIVALAAQVPGDPDWQAAAGGKMAFEVASVKPSKVPKMPSFPLDWGDEKTPGGRLSVGFPLLPYISFAYKLSPSEMRTVAFAQLPKWVNDDIFEIEARGEGNPTKDQMRLMMQSLLADRFKLAVHFESREGPVFALTLVRPGQTGPKLRPHADGPACPDSLDMSAISTPGPSRNASEVFPPVCGYPQVRTTSNGSLLGSRNMTMAVLADHIYNYGSLTGEVDKPVVDQTGLKGRYDFTLELPAGTLSFFPAAPNPDDPPKGTPFLNALRTQLGLKLERSKGDVRTLIIDHVERLSEN